MAAEKEKMYECEAKRRRLKEGGGYEAFWKVKTVAEALSDNDRELRCKDCRGEVKVLGKTSKVGAAAYVEHKNPDDSEYCISGARFKRATDGRVSRWSSRPVS
jgi:hypothetical protein